VTGAALVLWMPKINPLDLAACILFMLCSNARMRVVLFCRDWGMPDINSAPDSQSDNADQLEAAADQALATSGGDAREAIKALIVANHSLKIELGKLHTAVSTGYARGKLVPHDRKD
jgi:hypothetical protein